MEPRPSLSSPRPERIWSMTFMVGVLKSASAVSLGAKLTTLSTDLRFMFTVGTSFCSVARGLNILSPSTVIEWMVWAMVSSKLVLKPASTRCLAHVGTGSARAAT